jgi:hypothetical protein
MDMGKLPSHKTMQIKDMCTAEELLQSLRNYDSDLTVTDEDLISSFVML